MSIVLILIIIIIMAFEITTITIILLRKKNTRPIQRVQLTHSPSSFLPAPLPRLSLLTCYSHTGPPSLPPPALSHRLVQVVRSAGPWNPPSPAAVDLSVPLSFLQRTCPKRSGFSYRLSLAYLPVSPSENLASQLTRRLCFRGEILPHVHGCISEWRMGSHTT